MIDGRDKIFAFFFVTGDFSTRFSARAPQFAINIPNCSRQLILKRVEEQKKKSRRNMNFS